MPINHTFVRAVAAVILLIVVMGAPALAESSGQIQLDLSTTIELAVQNEINLGSAQAGLAEALAGIDKAEASKRPMASVSSSYTRLGEKPISLPIPGMPESSQNNFSTSLSIQWPLYTGGKITSGLSMAQLGLDSAQLELDSTVDNLMYQAVQGYISLLKAQSFVKLSTEFVATTAEHLEFVETNYELGYATKSDLLETRVRLSQAEQGLLQAKHGARLAEESLKNLLGIASDADLVLAALPGDMVSVEIPSVAEATETALRTRPELQGLRIAESVATESLAMAKAYWKPTVVAIGSYGSQGESLSLDGSWQATLSAQWQLYDGGAGAAGVAESEAGLAKVRSSLGQAENGISLEVRQKNLAVFEAIQAKEIAILTSKQAQESYEFVQAKYELGAATNLEVLTAQSTYNQAKNSEINTEYDYHLAILDLFKAMGQIENYISGVDVNA